jgi:cytoskeleton protein RodZ
LTEAGTGVGADLKRAREERGLALTDVAQQLKFSPRQLEALEEERFEALPGGTFARGMVRSYARLLKLDAEPLVGRLTGQLDTIQVGRLAERYREPVPFSDNARRSTFVYLGLSLGVLAIGGGVAYEWYRERSPAKSLAFVAPAKAPAEAKAPVETKAPAETKAPVESKRPAAASKPKPATPEPAVAPAPAAAPAQAQPAPTDANKPIARGPNRLVLRFEQEAWAEVKDGAERMLISSLNAAGTERVVRGQPPYTVVIGNASHVQVIYNDKPVDLQPYVKLEVARFTLK